MTTPTATLGYTIFTVEDVGATLDFYTAAFGIAQKMLSPQKDYGELATGETTLSFVSNATSATNLDDAGGYLPIDPSGPPQAGSITLVGPDVAAMVASALEHGATLYTSIADKPWGQTVAYLRDPAGILIEVATPIG